MLGLPKLCTPLTYFFFKLLPKFCNFGNFNDCIKKLILSLEFYKIAKLWR